MNANLSQTSNIYLHKIREIPASLTKLIRINALLFLFKLVFNCLALLLHLFSSAHTKFLLLQNPPAVPLFFVAWLAAKLRAQHLIIDWHNYGYSVLEFSLCCRRRHGDGRRLSTLNCGLVKIYRILECDFAARFMRNAAHFCVSDALSRDLLERHAIHATRLYDRAISPHRNTDGDGDDDGHALSNERAASLFDHLIGCVSTEFSAFKQRAARAIPANHNQTDAKLILSSCSWTADDRIDILIRALDLYDKLPRRPITKLFVVITGRGPLRTQYLQEIARHNWQHVRVFSVWLSVQHYRDILEAADLGVSVHESTSGLDLPMKIVDMFGAGLPVFALRYPTLCELVRDGHTGVLFDTADELCAALDELINDEGGRRDDAERGDAETSEKKQTLSETRMAQLRENVTEWSEWTWRHEWSERFAQILASSE